MYFGDESPFDPSSIIEDLDSGVLAEGTEDWLEAGNYFVKPFEIYSAGGYPDAERKEMQAKINGKQSVIVSYHNYRFRYTRFKKGYVTYSFYEDSCVLFAVYEFDQKRQKGKFRFTNQEKMSEYLAQLEVDSMHGNSPLTYAIPEEFLLPGKYPETGTRKVQIDHQTHNK